MLTTPALSLILVAVIGLLLNVEKEGLEFGAGPVPMQCE
jgi:ABC-type phosphate transport system auxiliary subunit